MAQSDVLAIVGPTASGKSELAERLAHEMDGEIVSADSMQIYRGMDIGTAKVRLEERTCPYHCIDILDPGEPFSVALFQKMGRKAIDEIRQRDKFPIVCGGSGFYVQALLYKMDFPKGEQVQNAVRERYAHYAQVNGADALHRLLEERDPESAAVIHPNNVRRVIRAFEMLEEGVSYARQKSELSQVDPFYRATTIGLSVPTDILYKRIDSRVDTMVKQGLFDEVKTLLACGFREGVCAPQAIGYKEFVPVIDAGLSTPSMEFSEAVSAVKQASRRYAKRQRTWFRRFDDIVWIDAPHGITDVVVDLSRQTVEKHT